MMTNESIWQAVLAELELELSKANFTTWFRNTSLSLMENNEVSVYVPNNFTKSWLEKKYHTSILKTLEQVLGARIQKVAYCVEKNPQKSQASFITQGFTFNHDSADNSLTVGPQAPVVQQNPNARGLHPRYVFENFIVSKSNELAHAAAQAVVSNPGASYNPLFIYGGVGLGKTHLMQAIGHSVLQQNQEAKVLYVSCETFTNDFIHAVRNGLAKEFKDRYRNVDVLIVDDIQFITGKEGTQEEFFHTFNALHQQDKQIIISSDRPPKAIPALEQRLLSRFEWGMIADISFPDVETRVAILEARCSERGIKVPSDVLHTIANHIQNNIRELEGALNKIIATIEMHKSEPTSEMVQQVLGSIKASRTIHSVSPKELIRVVSEYFDVGIDDMVGKSREKRIAFPRQIIMYLLRKEMKNSYPSIGAELGGRDHTTAIHAYEKIRKAVEVDNKLKADIQYIKERLYTPAA